MNRISRSGSNFGGIAHLFSIDIEPWLCVLSYCMCLSASFPCSFHLLLCPSIILWTHITLSKPFFFCYTSAEKLDEDRGEERIWKYLSCFLIKTKHLNGALESVQNTLRQHILSTAEILLPQGDKSGLPLDRAKTAAGVSAVMVLGEKG